MKTFCRKQEIKDAVTWKEAFEAGLEGKRIKPEGQGPTSCYYESLYDVIQRLAERPNYYKKIMLDKWYIEY